MSSADPSRPDSSRPDQSSTARGRWGEDRAATHLRRLGFEIVERNWICRRDGVSAEIDLIARLDGLIVFCEVKARRTAGYGGAAGAVDQRKQERLRIAAEVWLADNDLSDLDARFDVVAIEGVRLEHFEAAF